MIQVWKKKNIEKYDLNFFIILSMAKGRKMPSRQNKSIK